MKGKITADKASAWAGIMLKDFNLPVETLCQIQNMYHLLEHELTANPPILPTIRESIPDSRPTQTGDRS